MMASPMSAFEYACVFSRPPRERLVSAERFVRALPSFLPGVVAEGDLHHATATRFLAVVIRAAGGSVGPAALARLAFWAARTGGGGFTVADLSAAAAERLRGELNLCDRAVRGIPLSSLPDAAAHLFRAVKSPPPSAGAPVLAIELDGPGREGLQYDRDRNTLFFASGLSPPVGDVLSLAVRVRGQPAPVEGVATVIDVVERAAASAGSPAGFSLRIEGQPALQELLAAGVPAAHRGSRRAAPRFAVNAPVKVTPADAAEARAPAPAVPAPRARLEYATDQELAADWIENLSHGGAFVRTPTPRAVGTRLVLDLTLPDGVLLAVQAVVVASTARGMGVRFVLTPEQDDALAAVIARISARARRALVVDDDATVRLMISDALTARGFDVVTAADATEGIQRLSEELLALDLLVTDVCMPGMNGEEFIRFIRRAGGESELAIVAVTGQMEPGTERELEAVGADAVLDKAIGPELVAAAADAALERKRA